MSRHYGTFAALGVLLIATFGSFALGFGRLTSCTNEFSCGATCAPCDATETRLQVLWVTQLVLLLAALVVRAGMAFGWSHRRCTYALIGLFAISVLLFGLGVAFA